MLADIQEFQSNHGKVIPALTEDEQESIEDLASILRGFPEEVQEVANGAIEAIQLGAANLMAAMDAGGARENFPKDFYRGGGGLLDKALADVERAVATLYGPTRGRLRGLSQFLKKQGFGVQIELRAPELRLQSAPNASIVVNVNTQASIDWILAVNRLDSFEDGELHAGGTMNGFPNLALVECAGAEGLTMEANTNTGHWHIHAPGGNEAFLTGNYALKCGGASTSRARALRSDSVDRKLTHAAKRQ